MHAAIRRLQDGQRWWAAECAFRMVALILIALAHACFHWLEHSFAAPPSHQPTLAEFALATVGVVLGSAGLGFLIEGPGLFRLIPYPRRRLF